MSRTDELKELIVDHLEAHRSEIDADSFLRQVQVMVKVNMKTGELRSIVVWRESEVVLDNDQRHRET